MTSKIPTESGVAAVKRNIQRRVAIDQLMGPCWSTSGLLTRVLYNFKLIFVWDSL